jgi:hypothetical protein
MLPFLAPDIIHALAELEWKEFHLGDLLYGGNTTKDEINSRALASLAETVLQIEALLRTLPVSPGVQTQLERLSEATQPEANIGYFRPEVMAREFLHSFISDMRQHLFFMVQANDVILYAEPVKWFESGVPVVRKFKHVRADIERAGQCCALNQWTACVFHAMCVLDHGLKAMAKATKMPIKKGEWQQLINLLEDHLQSMRNNLAQPKKPLTQGQTRALRAAIGKYSEAAAQFRHVKDAWRNHTMHAGKVFDETQARSILTGVKYFMRALV